jgi:hypothetical protein
MAWWNAGVFNFFARNATLRKQRRIKVKLDVSYWPRACRLAQCIKSAAVWGTPVVASA